MNLRKYKAFILYVFFGGITTIINIGTYYFSYEALRWSNDVSNVLAWFITVTVAYITNKIWVFESKRSDVKTLLYEITTFFACRIATGIIDFVIMHLCVEELKLSALLLKTVTNIIVILLNYVASKIFIFKKEKTNG